uniref:NADH-ubiquinone oxidoreductase chain 4L n=1 Tax=Orfelia nemoralis TaxID=1588145 RepID=A0A7U3NIM4_9DIPT|nr:NADH dehydrogenase subunit 4L [Orfelia nemoralis]
MMMYIYFILFIIMFISGLIMFMLNRKHLLIMLLSLEMVVLSLFLILFMFLKLFNHEMYFLMMFLTFSVCEGALGLSILVSMIRTHGNNYFQSLNILLC